MEPTGAASPFSTHLPRRACPVPRYGVSIRLKVGLVSENILVAVRAAATVSAAYSPTKASRRAGSTLSKRFLGRFSTNLNRCG